MYQIDSQDQIFTRLKRHMRPNAHMYITGFEPFPHNVGENDKISPGAKVLLETSRLRDACFLLGKGRVYREFPIDWYALYDRSCC